MCNKEKQTAYAVKSNNMIETDCVSTVNANLKDHLELIHDNERHFQCSKCGSEQCQCVDASQNCHLKQHVMSVHDKRQHFRCEQCQCVAVSQSSHLKQHVISMHNKKQHFKCEKCEFAFSQKHNLEKHMELAHTESDETNLDDEMSQLIKSLHMTAEQTIGYIKRSKNPNLIDDKQIQQLSERRQNAIKSLREGPKTTDETSKCRYEINQLKNTIEKRIEEIHKNEANVVIESMNKIDDSKRMFAASKILHGNNNKNPLFVHDENKHNVESDDKKAEIIRNWFKKKLFKEHHETIEPFDGAPRPLEVPITPWEVYKAASKLNNDRAVGEDNTPNELFKYAGYQVHIKYCYLINKCFETNTYLKCIGAVISNPLPKPKKT